jgi:hypothetical protein
MGPNVSCTQKKKKYFVLSVQFSIIHSCVGLSKRLLVPLASCMLMLGCHYRLSERGGLLPTSSL